MLCRAFLRSVAARASAALKQLDVQQVDAQVQELADALQVADAAQAASQSLRESKYDKAAEELEKIEASRLDPPRRRPDGHRRHRETVRKYFESIRPTAEESEVVGEN